MGATPGVCGAGVRDTVMAPGPRVAAGARGPGPFEVPGRMPVLAKIEECSFHGSVRPGDVVTTEVAIERSVGSFIVLRATSRVGTHRILRCRLVVSIVTSNTDGAKEVAR